MLSTRFVRKVGYVEEIPSLEYVLLGIDHTAWGRRGAKTLKDRTYEHQASSHNSVTIGQGYSTVAWLPEKQGSWTLPLRQQPSQGGVRSRQ